MPFVAGYDPVLPFLLLLLPLLPLLLSITLAAIVGLRTLESGVCALEISQNLWLHRLTIPGYCLALAFGQQHQDSCRLTEH